MSALVDLAASLLTAARGIVAAFGCLCIVVHVLIPCLTVVGEFVVYELPSEVAKWQLQWAQQSELRALENRVAALKKRRARQRREEAQRAHEDYQMQASRRAEAQRRKKAETEQPKRRVVPKEAEETEEAARKTRTYVRDASRSSSTRAVAKEDAKPSLIPKPRLRLRSPNVMVDRRPVSAYVKASAGVTKPADRDRRAASSKARVLSLGGIFDEGVDENAAPVPRMWAN